MKKQSQKQKLQNIAYAKRSNRKRLKRLNRFPPENINENNEKNYRGDQQLRPKEAKAIKLLLPKIISLNHNYSETVKFFNQFKKYILEDQQQINLDFTTLEHLSPGATLVLAAEIDRWTRLYNFKPKIMNFNDWHPQTKSRLHEIGFFDLLKPINKPGQQSSFQQSPTHNHITFLKFASHNIADASMAKTLRENLEKVSKEKITRKSALFRAISEAITNVIKHAYPFSQKRKKTCISNRWWMTGSVDKNENIITVIFFDQGVGIPKTLPKKFGIELIMGWLDELGLKENDASIIRAAVEMGRSQTKLKHRGKGLPDIKGLIDKMKCGRLRILSGNGQYEYSYENGIILKNAAEALGGTLIQWDFPILIEPKQEKGLL